MAAGILAINQLINSVDVLIEIGDDTENWEERKKWLNSVLSELWKARGPYQWKKILVDSMS